jgi:DNA polymerase-3 subunit delta'
MSFSSVRDQAVATRLLRNIIQRGRVPNGLLFWGPPGVGKRLAALELAKAVNCTSGTGDACDTCLSCRKVAHGTHADVDIIAPEGPTRTIKVEKIKAMKEMASYRPFEGKFRVNIVLDANRMREDAQNHFLKTLEEPPSNTLFILVSEYPRILLPTIRSRCQQVRFGALRPETVTELLLRDHDLPEETAAAIAAVSQGQMSRALDLVETDKRAVVLSVVERLAKNEDPLALSEEFAAHLRSQEDAIKASVKAEANGGPEAGDFSREDVEEQKKEQVALVAALIRQDLMEYLYLLKTWYRDALVYRATGSTRHVLHRDQAERLAMEKDADMAARLGAIEKAWVYIERNLSMERVFRDLFFALAS